MRVHDVRGDLRDLPLESDRAKERQPVLGLRQLYARIFVETLPEPSDRLEVEHVILESVSVGTTDHLEEQALHPAVAQTHRDVQDAHLTMLIHV